MSWKHLSIHSCLLCPEEIVYFSGFAKAASIAASSQKFQWSSRLHPWNNLSSNGPQPRRLYFSLSSRISTVFTIRCTSYTADDIFQIRKLVRTQCVFPIFSFFSSHHGRDIPNCIAFCGTFVPRNVFPTGVSVLQQLCNHHLSWCFPWYFLLVDFFLIGTRPDEEVYLILLPDYQCVTTLNPKVMGPRPITSDNLRSSFLCFWIIFPVFLSL